MVAPLIVVVLRSVGSCFDLLVLWPRARFLVSKRSSPRILCSKGGKVPGDGGDNVLEALMQCNVKGLDTLQMAAMVKEWRGQTVDMVRCQLHHSRFRYSVMAVVTALWMSILALQAEAQPGTNIILHILQVHSTAYWNNACSCNVHHRVASLRSVIHYSRQYAVM